MFWLSYDGKNQQLELSGCLELLFPCPIVGIKLTVLVALSEREVATDKWIGPDVHGAN